MITEFLPAYRKLIQEWNYGKKEEKDRGCGEDAGACLLVGVRGRLFRIESEFQVLEPMAEYAADGSGIYHAMGSLYSTEGKEPKERITEALKAAEYFVCTVRSPFVIVETEVKQND